MKTIIEINTPYAASHLLERLSADPLYVVDRINHEVKVPIYTENKVVSVFFERNNGVTRLTITGDIEDEEKVLEKLKQIFLWDVNLQDISDHFKHTKLAPLFDIFYGTPIVCDFDLYGCLMKTIIHQQLNMKFAHELTSRFVKTFGFEVDGVPFYPEPSVVSKLEAEQLRQLQFSQRKAEYVIDTSKKIANGELDLEALRFKTDEEIIEKLVKIRGIGKWTAENFLLFGLGRPNLLPAADIGIQNALKRLYDLETKPKLDQVLELATEWEPYSSYASLYLWLSTERPQLVEEIYQKIE
ncbi:MAG: DNA-3-methyladenine glycosylase [Bacillaceae bacterium]|nr:DNA-3-methyladenine glycosylase [Bacillaceae bacterium]